MCDTEKNELSAEGIRKYIVNENLRNIDIFCYSETDSTNTRAKMHAQGGGGVSVFVADGQTAGRGRRGRSFNSERGAGLYISLITFPRGSAQDAVRITARAAVVLCRAIEALSSVSPKIKWVNDLTVNNKKLAGILTEGAIDESGELSYAVCGMGINLYKRSFPSEIADIATSIEDISGERISRAALAAMIIEGLLSEDNGEFMDDYRRLSSVIGETVTVYRGEECFSARAIDISDAGELIVERDGSEVRLFSGEVSIKKV